MRIPIDRNCATPLHAQITAFLRGQIQSGALAPGTRLPATRELASELGVSRLTISNAYAELDAEGLAYGELGSGTFVAGPLEPTILGSKLEDEPVWPLWQRELLADPWMAAQQEIQRLISLASRSHPNPISFAGGHGASELYPVEEFRKILQTVMRRDGAKALGYGERAGYAPLRATVAQILASDGISAQPDQILITSGSQHAIDLVARVLLRPGDAVLVEDPSYGGALDLFRSMGVRPVGVPVDDQGLRTDCLDEALRTHHPRLIYTVPTFHNPTGISLSGTRRRQLISLAGHHNIPILEDDFAGDLRYEGHAQPALKALDPDGRVIYVSTFSKMLMPGLRVGFLVASGPVYERLVAVKRVSDLATSTLMQRALEAYISVGRYRSYLRHACRLYRQRRDAMLSALRSCMPSEVRYLTPQGGLFLWLRLPSPLSAEDLHPVAAEEGVSFTPGSLFFSDGGAQPYLRLNFVSNPPAVIEEGIKRLGRAMERCLLSKGESSGMQRRRSPVEA